MSTVRTVPRYILPDAHLSPQPINRGPWALRTIRIRCEFHYVSILASFCVWTKSLICKDAVNMNSTVQSEVRRISKFPVSRPDDVSSRPDARQSSIIRPDYVLLPSGHFTVSRSFCASLFRLDVSAARPDAYQFSNGSLILSKFQEREDQSTVWTMWYTVLTRISVRQESQFKMNRLDI
jgi:hypothetical protein